MEGSVLLSHGALAMSILLFSTFMLTTSATEPLANDPFLEESCKKTLYPKLCYDTLQSYIAKIKKNPKILAQVALNVTLSSSKSSLDLVTKLSKSKGLNPRDAAALADCVEVIGDAVESLQNSAGEIGRLIGGPNDPVLDDIKTWVSAALTDGSTCLDGFSNGAKATAVKDSVVNRVTNLNQLTSITLALVNVLG